MEGIWRTELRTYLAYLCCLTIYAAVATPGRAGKGLSYVLNVVFGSLVDLVIGLLLLGFAYWFARQEFLQFRPHLDRQAALDDEDLRKETVCLD